MRDTSSNDTSSTTTLHLKFLSNYRFVEKSLHRMQFCRKRHFVEFFQSTGQAEIFSIRHVRFSDHTYDTEKHFLFMNLSFINLLRVGNCY